MKTRSLKKLLQLILQQGDQRFKNEGHYGLCGFVNYICGDNKITAQEWNILDEFIKHNRPKPGSVHYRSSKIGSAFYWKVCKWTPRRKWLKDQIKLSNEKENS